MIGDGKNCFALESSKVHCNIKALFSVLGGGLPQFNTSDLFLGRESLSYMPPDI